MVTRHGPQNNLATPLWGRRGTSPRSSNVSIRRRWVVSFAPWPLCLPDVMNTKYHWIDGLIGLGSSVDRKVARRKICPGTCGLKLGAETGHLPVVLALFCLFPQGTSNYVMTGSLHILCSSSFGSCLTLYHHLFKASLNKLKMDKYRPCSETLQVGIFFVFE